MISSLFNYLNRNHYSGYIFIFFFLFFIYYFLVYLALFLFHLTFFLLFFRLFLSCVGSISSFLRHRLLYLFFFFNVCRQVIVLCCTSFKHWLCVKSCVLSCQQILASVVAGAQETSSSIFHFYFLRSFILLLGFLCFVFLRRFIFVLYL